MNYLRRVNLICYVRQNSQPAFKNFENIHPACSESVLKKYW